MSTMLKWLALALTLCTVTSHNHTAPQSEQQRGIFLQFIAAQKPFACVCGVPNRDSRLLGGEYSGTHEFPWVTDVITQDNMAGAGTLINNRYVLTAGSLMRGFTPYDVKVTLGMHDRCTNDKSSLRMSVDNIRVHENYDLRTKANDIALLKLSSPIIFQRNMLPICLPTSGQTYLGQVATLVTWGQDEDDTGAGGEGVVTPVSVKRRKEGGRPQRQETVGEVPVGGVPVGEVPVGEVPVDAVDNSCRQRKVGLPVLERDQCEAALGKTYVSRDKGCVGIVNVPSMVCVTDAGGPVMFRSRLGIYELIGVLAASNDCLQSRGPSIYTRINDFTRWISYHTRDALYCSL